MTVVTDPTTRLGLLERVAIRYHDQEAARTRAAEEARRANERESVLTAAAKHIGWTYPETLAQVIDYADLTAYARTDEEHDPVRACAVTYLGNDIWLHYAGGDNARVTLLRRCVCGRYYEDRFTGDASLASAMFHGWGHRSVCFHNDPH